MKEYEVPLNRFVNFYHFDEVVSTMMEAEKLINSGVRKGIVLADSQTGGYGRNNRAWFSPDNGNIYISFFKEQDVEFIPQRAALAAFNTVSAFIDDGSVKIKWPNDILVSNRKVSGIIARSVICRNEKYLIAGIGMNVFVPEYKNCQFEWEPGAITQKVSTTTEKVLNRLILETDAAFSICEKDVVKKFTSAVKWMEKMKVRYTQDNLSYKDGLIAGFNKDGSVIKILTSNGEENLSTLSISALWNN